MIKPRVVGTSLLVCAALVVPLKLASLRAGTLAQFQTSVGLIDVELFDDDKPITVQNFIRYVQSGVYTTNLIFHRYVRNFVMQGGGFFVTDRETTNASVAAVPSFGQIRNEYSVGPRISNTFGTIAMAKVGGNPDSATSQWFFNLNNNASLDTNNGGFTVFGKVIRGTTVLNQFTNLLIANAGGVLAELPVRTPNPSIDDLVYVDISLLTADIALLPDNSRTIGWTSIRNRTNWVEFANGWPANWRSLTNFVGDGSRVTIVDAAMPARPRFYRVRADF